MNDLHSALKTSILQEVSEGGIHYKYVQLQHSKDDFINTLHARPQNGRLLDCRQLTSFVFLVSTGLPVRFIEVNAMSENCLRARI